MIEFAEIEVRCGAAACCSRCRTFGQPSVRSVDDVAAELSRLSETWTGGAGPNVVLCGSEPFDHPQLPALISAAARAGFERIGLRTAAGALTVAANAKGVIAAGVRFIDVVLLGDEATHDRLTGRSGDFADAIAGCRAFLSAAAEAAVEVVVTCRVRACHHNARALTGAVAGAAAAGAVAVHIDASGLSHGDADLVVAALETAAMSRMAGFVTDAEFDVPAPFGESPWRIVSATATHEGGDS